MKIIPIHKFKLRKLYPNIYYSVVGDPFIYKTKIQIYMHKSILHLMLIILYYTHNYRKISFDSKEAAWVCRNMSLWYFIAKNNSHSLILKWNIYDHSSVTHIYIYIGWFMVFNATFNNISVILWQSVLLVEEQGWIQRLCWRGRVGGAQLWSNIFNNRRNQF